MKFGLNSSLLQSSVLEIGSVVFMAISPKLPNIYIRLCFFFFVGVLAIFVIPIVYISSSVESEAKRSHKLLTKLNARRDLNISLRIRIKVCIELISNYLLIICFSIQQLMAFIERTAKNKIGFYCWKLFKMNQINCYQVITYLIISH